MSKDVTKKDVNKKEKENKDKRHFFKDFKAELKKVIWPTPKQLVNNTVAVITIVLITAVIVFALDLVFELMNDYGIDRLRNVIGNQNTEITETNQESENAENDASNNNVDETNSANNNEAENNTVNE